MTDERQLRYQRSILQWAGESDGPRVAALRNRDRGQITCIIVKGVQDMLERSAHGGSYLRICKAPRHYHTVNGGQSLQG